MRQKYLALHRHVRFHELLGRRKCPCPRRHISEDVHGNTKDKSGGGVGGNGGGDGRGDSTRTAVPDVHTEVVVEEAFVPSIRVARGAKYWCMQSEIVCTRTHM